MQDRINPEAEYEYLKQFAKQNCFDAEIIRDQLLCLWTAYCLHNGLDVDTLGYDRELAGVWAALMEGEPEEAGWKDFDSFDNYMCKYLV